MKVTKKQLLTEAARVFGAEVINTYEYCYPGDEWECGVKLRSGVKVVAPAQTRNGARRGLYAHLTLLQPLKPPGPQLSALERAEGWTVKELGGMRVKVLDIDKVERVHFRRLETT
jgi:hypothetical protein